MALNNQKKYVYFLYSEEQFKEKNEILGKAGKSFESGTVVVNGTRQKFTQLSSTPSLPRFIDTRVVAQGYIDQFIYTEPKITKRSGN